VSSSGAEEQEAAATRAIPKKTRTVRLRHGGHIVRAAFERGMIIIYPKI
jgi:hypothetical protein